MRIKIGEEELSGGQESFIRGGIESERERSRISKAMACTFLPNQVKNGLKSKQKFYILMIKVIEQLFRLKHFM